MNDLYNLVVIDTQVLKQVTELLPTANKNLMQTPTGLSNFQKFWSFQQISGLNTISKVCGTILNRFVYIGALADKSLAFGSQTF